MTQSTPHDPRFEYEFVRLGEGWLGMRKAALEDYQRIVHERAREGWRLVQVFAPSVGGYGTSKFLELIFERPTAPAKRSSS